MRLVFLLIIAALIVIPLSGNSLQYSKQNPNEFKISFQLPDYNTETELKSGKQLQKLKVTSSSEESWQESFSGLPQLEKWIYIPAGYDAQVTLENAETATKHNYNCDSDKTDNDVSDWLDVSEQAIFRGNRILSLCVKPFRYNSGAKQLQTLNSAEIRVRFVPSNNSVDDSRYYTPATVEMLKALCINRDDIRESTQKPGSYVIFYNGASLTGIIQQLADWKHQKGFDVNMVNIPTLGTNTNALKAYLQTAYDTWANPPEYVLILGRATTGDYVVPTYSFTYNFSTQGDYQYTLLDGNDIIPDAYVGRLTFSSTDELQTAINKILQYEKNNGLNTTVNWLNKAFLLGDVYVSGESCRTTINYVKGLIQDYNPTVQITETYSGSFPSQISAALNSGVGTYWYRGHGEFSGWTNSDISNLNNTGKYPFISYVTCFTGNFGNSISQLSPSEKFMRVGTPSLPKGAIGVIGVSCETHTCLNNILTGGFAYGMYNEGITQCGPVLVRGKLALMANYPQNPANYLNQNFLSFNLFGDPGLDIILKSVTEMVVTPPTALYAGGGSASVRVMLTDNTPVENAWVCLTKGANELFVSAYTDANGIVVLPYNILTSGDAVLTVTKPQHKTVQVTRTVNMDNPTFSLQPIPALNQCYAGSTLNFAATVTNNTLSTLSNVIGTLQSIDADITATNQVSFGSILAGATATSQSTFMMQINPEIPKGDAIYLNLHLTYDGGSFDIPISSVEKGPDFMLESAVYGGNCLSLGANTLMLSIKNTSQTAVNGLQSILESTNPLVTIQNPVQVLGNIAGNTISNIPGSYNIQVSDSLMEGMNIRFDLRLYNFSGFMQSVHIDKQIGLPSINDITGPDAYGYICYGTSDSAYVQYNWLELDPLQGGTGINLNFSDIDPEGSGDFSTVNIPFQFRFYGRTYSQITVCSNGFIMPGSQGSKEWMNWQIPGPMVPRPIIAPFWDDLLTDDQSRVLYKYDAGLHAMIVQWQGLQNKFAITNRETFQAILYDPLYHSSPTGDSPILFQYKNIYNVDSGNYGVDYVDHGQYATVGIADHTGLSGLCYTFNNQYPLTANPITQFSTLYFTTLPSFQVEPHPIILNCQLNEITGNGNGLADAGEQIGLNMIIKNTGLGSLTTSQATLSSTDPHVTITQSQAGLITLFSNQTANLAPAFIIQISSLCPNLYSIHLNLHIQNPQGQFDIPYDLVVHALQIDFSDVVVIDLNNSFPEPGETVQLSISLNNISLLPANDLVVTLTPPVGVTLLSASYTISLASMSAQTVSYQVSLDNTLVQGISIEFGLHTSVAGVYDSLFTFSLLVGIPDIAMNTGFEEPNLSTVIPYMYNVTITQAQYIHNTGNEAVMHLREYDPWSYIFTNAIATNDMQIARVKFTWINSNNSGNVSLRVFYSNQQNLLTIWNSSQASLSPQTTTVDLTDIPEGAEYVTFVLVGNLTGTEPSNIAIDDISILTLHHAPGFISGHVYLDLAPENVSQVRLYQRYSTIVYHPDINGDFLMPAYQGECIVYAVHEDYFNPDDSLSVMVVSGQTSTNNVIHLEKLRIPANLQYTITGNTINLTWELEGTELPFDGKDTSSKQDRYLIPDFYRIYFKLNAFNFQMTSTELSYSRNLVMNGLYQIYVCSIYLLDGGEIQTDSSNVISFQYTPNENDPEIPLVFALNQNSPNPFNPTTQISFSLPENSKTKLDIFNLKGQLVKTLIDAQYLRGNHSIVWNGMDNNNTPVSSGIYYYKLKWNNKELTRKMIMLK